MFHLLQTQHRSYTAELSTTHQSLSKLYKKLARTEQALVERDEKQLSRKQKKQLQWSKSTMRSAVEKLEWQQGYLHQSLAQCESLLGSYCAPSHWAQPQWMPRMPPTSFDLSLRFPGTAMSFVTSAHQPPPQYWDLSMLQERRQSGPYARSADSGFHEPAAHVHALALSQEAVDDPDHVFAHELMFPSTTRVPEKVQRETGSLLSAEKDDAYKLPKSPMPRTKQIMLAHRRRHSENPARLTEGAFVERQRATSVSLASESRRAGKILI